MANGSDTPLDVWLSAQPASAFPNGVKYFDRYKAVSEYLNEYVHPHVEKGALLRNDGFLTDHGPEHIATVIRRASCLLGSSPRISPYEAYLLLNGIHFHDVGNIFGREGHEKKHVEVMAKLGSLIQDEGVERMAILRIAGAHGGTVDGDKDTIRKLMPKEPLLGQHIRSQLLAAILRFSDELADDQSRAARFPLQLGVIPRKSEVYHQYAKHLHSVLIDPEKNQVVLSFALIGDAAKTKYGKGPGKVFLLNEIYERTLKMHLERKYCMRFLGPVVQLDSISVKIDVYTSDRNLSPIKTIEYCLDERGYPTLGGETLHDLCPEVQCTGVQLMRIMARQGDAT